MATTPSLSVTDPAPAETSRGTPDPGRHRVLLVLAAVLGLVATGYLAVAGNQLGAQLFAPDLWWYEPVPDAVRDRLHGGHAVVVNIAALGLWAGAWLLAGLAVRRGASVRALLLTGLVWALPLLVAPPLFSPDAYVYTAVGAAIEHGVDPYVAGPGAAGDIPAVRGAEPFWRDLPSPYSPPFLLLVSTLSRLFAEDLVSVAVAFRVLCVAAWALLAWLVPRLARQCGVDPRLAVWLGVVNPLVLVNAVSANHNDVLMMALLVAGVLLATTRHPVWAVVLCGAAAGIKVVALAAVLVVAVDSARRQTGRVAQLRALVGLGAAGAATFAVLAQLSGFGWGWVTALSVPGAAVEPLAPATALAKVLDAGDPPLDAVRSVVTVLGLLGCLVLLTRLPQWGLVRVTAWVLLVSIVTGPVVWPWYFLWPVLLFAAAGRPRERQVLVLGSMVLLLATLPGGASTASWTGLPEPLPSLLVLTGLAAVVAWYGSRAVLDQRRGAGRPVPG